MAEIVQTRRIPIHSSLLRPQLLGGGERKLVLVNGILGLGVAMSVGTLPGVISAVVLCVLVHVLLVKMGKTDPQMSQIFIRHRPYQKFYPAHTLPAPEFKRIKE